MDQRVSLQNELPARDFMQNGWCVCVCKKAPGILFSDIIPESPKMKREWDAGNTTPLSSAKTAGMQVIHTTPFWEKNVPACKTFLSFQSQVSWAKKSEEKSFLNNTRWAPYDRYKWSYNLSKWPKINGFAWGYFTPINWVMGPLLITGDGAHLAERHPYHLLIPPRYATTAWCAVVSRMILHVNRSWVRRWMGPGWRFRNVKSWGWPWDLKENPPGTLKVNQF